MNPNALPPPDRFSARIAFSVFKMVGLSVLIVVMTVLMPIVMFVGYHIVMSEFIAWQFNSRDLNQKIVALKFDWHESRRQLDVSSFFPANVSFDELHQKLLAQGYSCKIDEQETRSIRCETRAGYDTFCRRDVFVVAVFDRAGHVGSILANPYENC